MTAPPDTTDHNCEQPQVPNGSDNMSQHETKKFSLGRIVATPGALHALQECRSDRPMSSSPATSPATGATSTTRIAASTTLP